MQDLRSRSYPRSYATSSVFTPHRNNIKPSASSTQTNSRVSCKEPCYAFFASMDTLVCAKPIRSTQSAYLNGFVELNEPAPETTLLGPTEITWPPLIALIALGLMFSVL